METSKQGKQCTQKLLQYEKFWEPAHEEPRALLFEAVCPRVFSLNRGAQ